MALEALEAQVDQETLMAQEVLVDREVLMVVLGTAQILADQAQTILALSPVLALLALVQAQIPVFLLHQAACLHPQLRVMVIARAAAAGRVAAQILRAATSITQPA